MIPRLRRWHRTRRRAALPGWYHRGYTDEQMSAALPSIQDQHASTEQRMAYLAGRADCAMGHPDRAGCFGMIRESD